MNGDDENGKIQCYHKGKAESSEHTAIRMPNGYNTKIDTAAGCRQCVCDRHMHLQPDIVLN